MYFAVAVPAAATATQPMTLIVPVAIDATSGPLL